MDRDVVKLALEDFEKWKIEAEKEEFVIPHDIFDNVVGYDDLKQLLVSSA